MAAEVHDTGGNSVAVFKWNDGTIGISPVGAPVLNIDRDNTQALIVKLISVLRHADKTEGDQ